MKKITLAEIRKLKGIFIVAMQYKENLLQFVIKKEELIHELKRSNLLTSQFDYLSFVDTHHTIFLI